MGDPMWHNVLNITHDASSLSVLTFSLRRKARDHFNCAARTHVVYGHMWHLRQAWAEKSASCDVLQRWHDGRPHGAAVECSAQQRQCRCSVDLPLHTRPQKRYTRFREQSSSTWSAWSHDVEPCFFGASGFWRRALTSLVRDADRSAAYTSGGGVRPCLD